MSLQITNQKKRRQPSRATRQAVIDNFDAAALIDICTRDDFSDYAEYVELAADPHDGHRRFYWHQDNGSQILAVGHLDTVQSNRACTVTETPSGLLACSGGLDDRLGVYVILELLPRLGITCDWLLTTDEEKGRSTASDFVPEKDYNWIIEFDRGGKDVVMYQYETLDLIELVENSGARVGQGIWSDICVLEHLGCAGFNWGVGYEDYHSARSHAWLDDTFRMVARFVKFWRANHDVWLPNESEHWWDLYMDARGGRVTPTDDGEVDSRLDEDQWWKEREWLEKYEELLEEYDAERRDDNGQEELQ